MANVPRLLVVEDDLDARDALAVLLEAQDYEVDVVATAEDALAAVRVVQPDVAIIDLGLPQVDGCELIARVRGNVPGAFIIAYSGFHRLQAPAAAAGADAFVLKPDVDGLLRALDGVRAVRDASGGTR
jgi:CheY-like chemotaxis protein